MRGGHHVQAETLDWDACWPVLLAYQGGCACTAATLHVLRMMTFGGREIWVARCSDIELDFMCCFSGTSLHQMAALQAQTLHGH